MTGGEVRAAAHARLLSTLAEAAGCTDFADCPGKACLCRAQARAVAGVFWLRLRPEPVSPRKRGPATAAAAAEARAKARQGSRKGGWTKDAEDALRVLWDRLPPLRIEDMATELSRSYWGVKAKAAELHLRRRDWGPGKPRQAPE